MLMPSAIPPMTVRFSEQTRENVARFAKLTKRSKSFIINEAVEQYLDDKIAYLKDLNEAVASINTHATPPAEDVFSWIHTWGTDEEKSLEKSGLLGNQTS